MRFLRYSHGLAERGVSMQVVTQAHNGAAAASQGLIPHEGSSSSGPSKANGSAPVANKDVVDGLPVSYLSLPDDWRRQYLFYKQLLEYCGAQGRKIDVVQFTNLDRWAIPWMRRLRRLGIATVLSNTVVGQDSSNWLKRLLIRFDRRIPYNMVDHVVAATRVMAQSLEDLGVKTPITVIPNGVDVRRFQPIDSADARGHLRKKLGMDPQHKVVLSVGAIEPRKGVDILVEAFARVCRSDADAQLILAGPRYDLNSDALATFHRRLEGIIADGDIRDRVRFLGTVENIHDYYRVADVFVLASRREGMPNAALEAMASGVPVIMTPFVGLSEEFGSQGREYLLTGWDPERLASDIEELLADEQHRHELGKKARRWAVETLDVNLSLDRYAALYSCMASLQKSSPRLRSKSRSLS